MAIINPSINFNGNAEEAFSFYKSAFGGEFKKIIRFKDMPSDPAQPIPEDEANKLMHISLAIGPNVLIGNDVPSFMGTVNENENRSKISIQAESKEEAEHLYNHLSDGGTVEVPLEESPWGSYFAMFRDQFGIEWMIDFNPANSNMTTLSQLTEAHRSLSSLLHKCEKAGEKLIPGTPQKTLITRRIEALHIALGLIDQQIKQTKE